MKGKKNYKLLKLLDDMGYSQTRLALELGCSYPCLQNKVAGKRDFLATEIAKIQEIFQLTAEEVEDIFLKE